MESRLSDAIWCDNKFQLASALASPWLPLASPLPPSCSLFSSSTSFSPFYTCSAAASLGYRSCCSSCCSPSAHPASPSARLASPSARPTSPSARFPLRMVETFSDVRLVNAVGRSGTPNNNVEWEVGLEVACSALLEPLFYKTQRKTKGQQLKGKIVSALFHTFWHFSTHFHTFQSFLSDFSCRIFIRIKGFYYCFNSKRRKDNKENTRKKTKPFCMLVVARLPSSEKQSYEKKEVSSSSSSISSVVLMWCWQLLRSVSCRAERLSSEKSTLWTDTGVDQNFQGDLGAIGPYEFQGKFIWTNGPFAFFQEIRMDK